ncbi:TetR/AcrR family transcriptional regulator [Bifidobacterium simiarum]|uniref:TetR family transcriptional regulator n=1 Tax=Bifidobacterium simiarum TaxID=2045441 RepID=A0A2M9HG84_9BIFI|nr:TetR/AcrR family transcriptional regulator [Bifidobacterium simiarum]MBT1167023.1 TetR/AcrR family transcriptional regulator [Bifidobacterium simiarum]PJM75840.1 TetR family transcriptional regulator [Bifidobacterium simiarum]
MNSARAERTRKETDRKIMQATLQIAVSKGLGRVSIEEVARRSGVAKTTIYRRYQNADDLLNKITSLEISSSPELAELEPTQGNLELLLHRMADRFATSIGVKAVGIVLSSEEDFFRNIVQQVIDPEERTLGDFFRRGIDAGVFRDGLNTKMLFGTVLGSMIACEALRGAVSDDWPHEMTALIWPAIARA